MQWYIFTPIYLLFGNLSMQQENMPKEHTELAHLYIYIYMKGLEAKGPFWCLGLQLRIKRAY